MGLNVASLNTANIGKSAIDVQALSRVKEQILNPNNDKTIDVSKLDLSKFNRASLGTNLYAERTNGEIALKAAKAASDFDVKFSQQFNSNIQYLNSLAAQGSMTVKETTPAAISIDVNNQTINEQQVVEATTQTSETQDMNKDRRGSNPFSFYANIENENEPEDLESSLSSINIFA